MVRTFQDAMMQARVKNADDESLHQLVMALGLMVESLLQSLSGTNYTRLDKIRLEAGESRRILRRDQARLRRKVVVLADLRPGQDDTSIRVGPQSGVTPSTNGLPLYPGVPLDIGYVDSSTELFAASNIGVDIYVMEGA